MNNRKKLYLLLSIFIIFIFTILLYRLVSNNNKTATKLLDVTILSKDNSVATILDQDNNIYKIYFPVEDIEAGDTLVIEYSGIFDHLKTYQAVEIVDYAEKNIESDTNEIPTLWDDQGIFSDYYVMAYNKLKQLSKEEKIGQLIMARYPGGNIDEILNKYKLSGFVFYEKDFQNKDKNQVKDMINYTQKNSNIPLLIAVDEEGGTVVRVSSNSKLVEEKFKSPSELYNLGGFEKIRDDTILKSKVLSELGINVNLAPVVDVSTDPSDYIYNRTLGQNTELTSIYAKTVINASKGTGVSYVLKHFPGYGSNSDTHLGESTSVKTYQELLNVDIPPFISGIEAKAEAILISHNIVNSIDPDNPASLSPTVHNLLRNDLGFTGVVITDDISMKALENIDNVAVNAVLAGNNIIITTDYEQTFNEIKNALDTGKISESLIDQLVFKVLAWKYSKGLMLLYK